MSKKNINVLVILDINKQHPFVCDYDLIEELIQETTVFDEKKYKKNIHVTSFNDLNKDLFNNTKKQPIYVYEASEKEKKLTIENGKVILMKEEYLTKKDFGIYDFLVLRVPQLDEFKFHEFLKKNFKNGDKNIINAPKGRENVTKEWLLNVKDLCPKMKVCGTLKETLEFYKELEKTGIILKPFLGCKGRGLIKIVGGTVCFDNEDKKYILSECYEKLEEALKNRKHLGMQYLPNYYRGDKRTVVINGKIVGAGLRVPKEGEWLCNRARGGTYNKTEVTKEEVYIAQKLAPLLKEEGIIHFGMDTLEDDNGKRVLSEVNCNCVGGLNHISRVSGTNVTKLAAIEYLKYFQSLLKN